MNRQRQEGEDFELYRIDQNVKASILRRYLKHGRMFHESAKPVTIENPDTHEKVTVIEKTGGTYKRPEPKPDSKRDRWRKRAA